MAEKDLPGQGERCAMKSLIAAVESLLELVKLMGEEFDVVKKRLDEMQKQLDEVKDRLDVLEVRGASAGGSHKWTYVYEGDRGGTAGKPIAVFGDAPFCTFTVGLN